MRESRQSSYSSRPPQRRTPPSHQTASRREPYRQNPRTVSRHSNPKSGRARSYSQSRGRRPVKRRRRPRRRLSLRFIILTLIVVIALILLLKSCIGGHEKPNYTLDLSSQTMLVGETEQACVAGVPEDLQDSIIWSSNDTSIVSVNHAGVIKARRDGTATIAATIDGETVSGTISVKNGIDSSITLDQKMITLKPGDTCQLTAQVATEDEETAPSVTWTSNKASVAQVSELGLVTAQEEGTAKIQASTGKHTAVCTITVQSEDTASTIQNENTVSAHSAQQEPSVTKVSSEKKTPSASVKAPEKQPEKTEPKKEPNPDTKDSSTTNNQSPTSEETPTKVTISQTFAYVAEGETLPLEAIVTPNTPEQAPIIWNSSDSSIASVSGGLVTAKKEGSVTISATSGDSSASCTIEVTPDHEPEETAE